MPHTNRNLRILVSLDGSSQAEAALPLARTLAAGHGEIIVLRVVANQESPYITAGLFRTPTEAELASQVDDAQHASEASITPYDDMSGLSWRAETHVGDPADLILRAAAEHDVEFIVMASTGKGAFARLMLGSVADRVARTSPLPVLIVHAGAEPVVTRLLVPIDGSDRSRSAIPVARDLAVRLSVPITFVSLIDYTNVTAGGLGTTLATGSLIEHLTAEASAVGRQALNDAVSEVQAAGVVTTTRLLRGIAGEALLEATEPGDLIVMSSHGRSGVTRWLIGSVAEKLVRAGTSPVLLVSAREANAAEHGKAPS